MMYALSFKFKKKIMKVQFNHVDSQCKIVTTKYLFEKKNIPSLWK